MLALWRTSISHHRPVPLIRMLLLHLSTSALLLFLFTVLITCHLPLTCVF